MNILAGDYRSTQFRLLPNERGDFAIVFLLASLACTPIYILTGYRGVLRIKRGLGLFSFFYAFCHMILYVGVDYGFVWDWILPTIIEKRFMIVGFFAFLILVALAITSFRWWMVRMGKGWKRLHQLVYVAGVLAVFHFAWAVKGDIFLLRGNIIWPGVAISLLAVLLMLRIPPIRRRVSKIKAAIGRKRDKYKAIDGAKDLQQP